MRLRELPKAFLVPFLFVIPSIVGAVPFAGMTTTGNTTSRNAPVIQQRVHNNTGMDATDFHFKVRVKEVSNLIQGLKAASSAFANVTATRINNYSFQINMDGGLVPNGGAMDLLVQLFIRSRNVVWPFDGVWTFDQAPPQAKGGDNGFDVGNPKPGGNGGGGANNPNGAGGMGAQEGNGGSGFYTHLVALYNLSDDPLLFSNLKLLASDAAYADLAAIDWLSIAPINIAPTVVDPGDALFYSFETVGAYLGGHIYMAYETLPAVQPLVATSVLDPDLTYGDHPVVVPIPAAFWLMGAALIGLAVGQRRRTAGPQPAAIAA